MRSAHDAGGAAPGRTPEPPVTGLIDAAALRAELGDPALRLLDGTVILDFPPDGGPPKVTSGRAGYDAGHIPGAAFADLVTDLSDPASGLPFTAPPAERFAAAIGALGVGDDSRVVVYDQGATTWAARLWWLLRYFGFDDVRVLDGGLPAWKAAGGELSIEPPRHAAATFTPRTRPELLATREDVLAAMDDGATCIVNALDEAMYRAGRIPGSSHLAASSLLDPVTGRVRPVAELRRAVAEVVPAGGPAPIASCGGGIAATLDVFAFALAGREDARMYDGSLTDWTSDPSLPLEKG
jgi:thiosulfate/3-mercaptopyruvate sulfurtransferase